MEYKEYIPQSVAEQTSPPALMVGYYLAYIPSVPAHTLPHMVTIKELIAECWEKGIAVTERFIDYLNGEIPPEDSSQKQGTIRPIPVKL